MKLHLRHFYIIKLVGGLLWILAIKTTRGRGKEFLRAQNPCEKQHGFAINEAILKGSDKSIAGSLFGELLLQLCVFILLTPLHHGIVLDQSLSKMSYNVIVVIHHYTKWLPDDETRPYDDVAPSGAAVSFRHLAQHRQWYLEWTISAARLEFPYLRAGTMDLASCIQDILYCAT